ncbi:hypothetical protein MFUR16E_04770 [Methylobacterium fujisawaense]|uniref:phage GP46 family protein n=1 Tax=Methylobacterium fujisawaense TaxID=107400 RepID=UPI002F329412
MQIDITPLADLGVATLPPDIVWLRADGTPVAPGEYGVRGDFAVASTQAQGGAGGLVARMPLASAVHLLLWTDAAPPPELLRRFGLRDARGWPGDGFDVDTANGEQALGSYFWVYRRAELSVQIGLELQAEAKRALSPLLRQGAVARIVAVCTIDEVHDRAALDVGLYARDGTTLYAKRFDPLWDLVRGGL